MTINSGTTINTPYTGVLGLSCLTTIQIKPIARRLQSSAQQKTSGGGSFNKAKNLIVHTLNNDQHKAWTEAKRWVQGSHEMQTAIRENLCLIQGQLVIVI